MTNSPAATNSPSPMAIPAVRSFLDISIFNLLNLARPEKNATWTGINGTTITQAGQLAHYRPRLPMAQENKADCG
jgi:hypothetical protein